MSLTRRQFFAHSALAATAGALTGLPAALAAESRKQQPLPIVDCHQHLWDLTKFKLSWLQPNTLLGKSYQMDDYLKAAEGLGIDRAVYMEVDVIPEQQLAEAEAVIAVCQSGQFPTVAGVISGRPAEAAFEPYIRKLAKSPYIKGVRQVLHVPTVKPGMILGEDFVRGIRLLGELGLSYDLCPRTPELSDGAKLVGLCSDTRFIVDHCGNIDPKAFLSANRRGDAKPSDAEKWKKDIAALAERKNVICKISGIVARVPKPWSAADLAKPINHCLDCFGPDRVIFGSDWPVCLGGATLHEWVVALREIIAERPLADQKKLWSENAVKFYGLVERR